MSNSTEFATIEAAQAALADAVASAMPFAAVEAVDTASAAVVWARLEGATFVTGILVIDRSNPLAESPAAQYLPGGEMEDFRWGYCVCDEFMGEIYTDSDMNRAIRKLTDVVERDAEASAPTRHAA